MHCVPGTISVSDLSIYFHLLKRRPTTSKMFLSLYCTKQVLPLLCVSSKVVTQVEGTDMASLEHQIEENINGPRDTPQDGPREDEMYFDPR